MFSALMKKYNLKKYDLIPISLYTLSVLIMIYSFLSCLRMFIFPMYEYRFNPFIYVLFMLVPSYAYLYVMHSSILNGTKHKFDYFIFSFATIAFAVFHMLTRFMHFCIWSFFTSTNVYNIYNDGIIAANEFCSFMRPVVFIIPVIATIFLVNWFVRFANASDTRKGLYAHFDVDMKKETFMKTGNLTCEVPVCVDGANHSTITIPEKVRMEGTLIQGSTGTGKTSTLLIPMAAHDLEKKYFFKEYSKSLAFEALEEGLGYIDAPYSNEGINRFFNLNMLKPLNGKESLLENKLKEVIKYKDPRTGKVYFADCGIVILEPDGEYVKKMKSVGENLGVDFISIDPDDPNSLGMNPFVASDPTKVAAIISNVLKGMYEAENPGDNNVFFAQVTQQAIENLSILLKVMYPIMHNGLLPSLEDMLKCLHNYLLVEEMCEEMKKYDELSSKYKILISYFEKNFYRIPINALGLPISGSSVGSGRKSTEQFLYGAITQLDNILRQKDVKRILCSRTNNVDFDKALEDGTCIAVCTRRGRLSSILAKAFGMFFLLSFQDAVLRRPGNENTRIPFFFYIDEFPDFVNKETETCFTLFRKYRCGMIVAIQNLSQLERTKAMAFYKDVVLSNTSTQLVFSDTSFEDADYWTNAMGRRLTLKYGYGVKHDYIDGPDTMSQGYGFSPIIKPFVFQGMKFKAVSYKTKTAQGTQIVGKGKTDFLNKKYENPFPIKTYDFEKYKITTDYAEHRELKDNEPFDTIEKPFDFKRFEEDEVRPDPIIDLGDIMKSDLDNSTSLTAQEVNALKDLIDASNIDIDEVDIELGDSIKEDK